MHRHPAPVEAVNINMHAIPSMYFRPPSPHRSRASTSVPVPVQLQVHMSASRSSASSAASQSHSIPEREREERKERKNVKGHGHVVAPALRRGNNSSGSTSTSSSGSSRGYGYGPTAAHLYRQSVNLQRRPSTLTSTSPPPPMLSTSSSTSSSSSRTRSRPHSITTRPNDRRNPNTNTNPDSIPQLRSALGTLESKMASLALERQRLSSRLEHAVRAQSPVQRLPRELLGSIFEIGVHPRDNAEEEEDALLLSTLMRVCKSWTDVALNTPVLWSRILIDSPMSVPKARRKLTRSRAVPLDVTIQFGPTVDPEGYGVRAEGGHAVVETVVRAMDLLQPALWRWRSFRLAVPTHAHAAAALSQCTAAAPMLEVLAVQVHHVLNSSSSRSSSRSARYAPLTLNSFLDEDTGKMLFGGDVPRLRFCALTSFDAGWGGPIMRGLTVLRLGGFWNGAAPGVRALMGVLRACPMLEELALRNMSDVEGEPGVGGEGGAGMGCGCFDFDGLSKVGRSHSHVHSDRHSHSMRTREADIMNPNLIHLPRLKRASFYYSGAVRTVSLLAQLSFPALERLEFAYLDNLTPVFTHLKRQASSYVPRGDLGDGKEMWGTGLPLKSLRIESCLVNELKLVRLLRRVPTLRTLELVDVEDASEGLLAALSSPSSSSSGASGPEWICPLLETLNLDGCNGVPWDALRALVEARLPVSVHACSSASGYAARYSGSDSGSGPGAGVGISSASGTASGTSRLSCSSFSSRDESQYPYPYSYSYDDEGRSGGRRPKRLRVVDVTRCAQISREMVVWLRMYVDEVRVRCEGERMGWGEFGSFGGFGFGG